MGPKAPLLHKTTVRGDPVLDFKFGPMSFKLCSVVHGRHHCYYCGNRPPISTCTETIDHINFPAIWHMPSLTTIGKSIMHCLIYSIEVCYVCISLCNSLGNISPILNNYNSNIYILTNESAPDI